MIDRFARMKTLMLLVILVPIGLNAGCGKGDNMSTLEFTQEYARMVREARPELKVEIVNDLELRLTPVEGESHTMFLQNAYDIAKQDPSLSSEVIQGYVAAAIESLDAYGKELDRNRIVPVIKDRAWVDDQRQFRIARGEDTPKLAVEDFSGDLVIIYAEDLPSNTRFLLREDLDNANIDPNELRTLACGNLHRLLPKAELIGENGLYMLTAGGDYEASLLLFDSIWSGGQIDVKGDIVVAVHAKGILLVTGSEDSENLTRVRQQVNEILETAAYRLSLKLHVYRNGKFEEFRE